MEKSATDRCPCLRFRSPPATSDLAGVCPKTLCSSAEKAEKLNEKLEDIRRQKAKKAADEQLEKERARREDGKKLAELQRQRDDQQQRVACCCFLVLELI